jgi:hypothetical protein
VQDNICALHIPGAVGNNYIEMYSTTAQSQVPVPATNKGLLISGDEVNNEAVEYVLGGNRSYNPLGYLAGTDPSVFLDVIFELEDADGLDQFGIFWRKQENFAVPVSFLTTGDPVYTDICLLGFAAAVANPNVIRQSTDLNNSGSASVSSSGFTVPDGGYVRLRQEIRSRVVHTFINTIKLPGRIKGDGIGGSITAQYASAVSEFTFDSGDFLVPGIFVRQDANVSKVYARRIECGQRLEVGDDDAGRTA